MKESGTYTDQELLRLLAQSDETAFTIIYDQYRDRIFRTAIHHTGSSTLSEEVVQDVFLQLWLKRSQAESILNIKAYLHGIAEHLIYKAWKRTKINPELLAHSEPDFESTPQALLEHKDYEQILHSAIAQLPEKQRLTYQLIKEQGLNRVETARQLSVSSETVKSNLDHAVRNIRAFCLARIGVSTTILVLLRVL